ncbi:MAG: RHS repeat-associated protein, partial [Polyangiales bacterium]
YDGPLVTDVATAGLPGGAHAVHFAYDDGDEMALSSIGVDAEAPIVRTYDNDGILTSAGALTLTPDADSGLLNDATAGLVNTTYARNGYGEPSLETHSWAGAGGSGTLGFTYGYDRESRLTQRVETLGVVTETLDYIHDARGRLVDVFVDSGAAATYHYDYDENDNRIGWNTPAGACVPTVALPCVDIDAQDRLLRHDDITFVYNDRGQRISRSQPGGGGTLTTTYEYDEVGNLWRVVLPDTTVVSYRVDGLGRRVARFVDGVADAYWLYQDGLNPVAQLDGAGNVTQQYVYATRLNVPDLIIEGGVTYRVLTDQVGSVRRVVDTATGATVLEREYSPYGALEFSNGSFGQPFGYAGGLEDSLTGLVRFGARDYDPEVGRWTAKDPILTSGGVNLYEYGASAPQMFVDPNGRFVILAAIGIAALTNGVINGYIEYSTGNGSFLGGLGRGIVGGTVGAVASIAAIALGPAGAAAIGGATSNAITTTLNEIFGNAGFNSRSPLKIVVSTACGAAFGGAGGYGANGVVNQASPLLGKAGDDAAAIVEALIGNMFGSGVSAPGPAGVDLTYELL